MLKRVMRCLSLFLIGFGIALFQLWAVQAQTGQDAAIFVSLGAATTAIAGLSYLVWNEAR